MMGPFAAAKPTLFGPACSPKLRVRLMNRIRGSANFATVSAVSSVQASPTMIISQSSKL